MAKPKAEVIITHETILQSWARDAGTFAMLAGLIGLGVFLDSTALQWVGAVMAFIFLGIRSTGKIKRMSVPEARAYLASIEEGVA